MPLIFSSTAQVLLIYGSTSQQSMTKIVTETTAHYHQLSRSKSPLKQLARTAVIKQPFLSSHVSPQPQPPNARGAVTATGAGARTFLVVSGGDIISPFLLYHALADAAVNDTKNKTTSRIPIVFLMFIPHTPN